jgi:hypothetical protein
MKRTFAIITTLLLTVSVSSSFAHSTNNNNSISINNGEITAYFHKDFSTAELLDTKSTGDYTKLTFKMNGMVLTAFYSNKGELLAVTHNITSAQLPLTLLMQVKRNYAGYWISDLFELNSNGESNYYITLENADKKITLRSIENNWEAFSKTTKE